MSAQMPASPRVPQDASRSSLPSEAPSDARRMRLPEWAREPLLHFVLIGAALFAADHYFVSQKDDPNTIVVGKAVTDEARNLFRNASKREPTAVELKALTERWLDNEILFREGLAMQVDKGDNMIRDRVIFKSLMMVQTELKLPPADDQVLRQWFEKNRAKYDEPARYDFQEAVMPPDATPAALRALVQQLNAGTPGETQAGLRVFKGRPHENLVQSYGADFAKALETGTPGEWRLLASREGERLVRLEAVTPPKAAVYENLRNTVLPDWTDATMAQMRTDAVRQRGKKYTIRFEDAPK